MSHTNIAQATHFDYKVAFSLSHFYLDRINHSILLLLLDLLLDNVMIFSFTLDYSHY